MDARLAAKLKFILPAAIVAGLVYLLAPAEETGSIRPDRARKHVELSFPRIDGAGWTLASERGKVVLVNFWATWCAPCRHEIPALVNIFNDYRDRGATIVGVSLDEDSPQAVRDFARSRHIPYPILLPAANSAITAAIESIPTTLLIDKQGRVALTYRGAASERTFRRDIEALLRE